MATTRFAQDKTAAVPQGRLAGVWRIVLRLAGVALFLCAAGLWFAPGVQTTPDMIFFKLVLTALFAVSGVLLLRGGGTCAQPVIELDTIRREMRVTRPGRDSAHTTFTRCAFRDLARVVQEGDVLRLWDSTGTCVGSVKLGCDAGAHSILGALRDAGKLR